MAELVEIDINEIDNNSKRDHLVSIARFQAGLLRQEAGNLVEDAEVIETLARECRKLYNLLSEVAAIPAVQEAPDIVFHEIPDELMARIKEMVK